MEQLLRLGPQYLFFSLLAVQSAIAFSLPLIPYQNDSAWYYMNVHFVETGQYIHEMVYRFSEPSQLYPFFGYSLFLYFCKKLAFATSLSFPFLVKLFQLIMYFFTAVITVNISFELTRRKTLSYVCGLFVLMYYSYFSFVYAMMSETYAIFLLLLSSYLFIRSLSTLSSRFIAPLFVISGHLSIVKPVLLPAVLCFVSFLGPKCCRARKYGLLLALPLLPLFPAMQAVFSKANYDNFDIRTGFGWNIWNRVIWNDKLMPTHSEGFSNLTRIYKDHGREVNLGFWWEVARDLSEFGFKERETQEICKRVALDGLREFPLRYLSSVLYDTYRSFNDPVEAREIHDSQRKYISLISAFASDRQHLPVVDQLSGQSLNHFGHTFLLAFHNKMALSFNRLAATFHNQVIFVLFLIIGSYCVWELIRSRFESCVEAFTFWLVAFSVVLCSNMVEVRWDRYTLPAVIFVLLSFVLATNHYLEKNGLRHLLHKWRDS
jgi:hypothetical protein